MTEKEVYSIAIGYSKQFAGKYKANPEELATVLVAIAKVESNLNPSAKNKSSTARGLMQFLICTQREVEKKRAKTGFAPAMYSCKVYPTKTVSLSEDKMFEPDYAIKLAVHEIGYQFSRYKKWNMAIHAYNQGSCRAKNSEGNKYAAKVGSKLNLDLATIDNGKRREFY